MKRYSVVIAILAVALVVPSVGSTASSYQWPLWFTRGQISGCVDARVPGFGHVGCGCMIRALKRTMPYSEALRLEKALTNGDIPSSSSMRKLRAARFWC